MKSFMCVLLFLAATAHAGYLSSGWSSPSYSSEWSGLSSGWDGLSSGWSSPVYSAPVIYKTAPVIYKSAPIYSAPIVVKKYVSSPLISKVIRLSGPKYSSGWW